MKTTLALLMVTCLFSTAILASEMDGIDTMSTEDIISRPQQSSSKHTSPQRAIEEFQEYLLNEVFLKDMFTENSSLLTEEDQQASPVPIDNNVQNDMMRQALAKKLAQDDVLHLKKILSKYAHQERASSERAD